MAFVTGAAALLTFTSSTGSGCSCSQRPSNAVRTSALSTRLSRSSFFGTETRAVDASPANNRSLIHMALGKVVVAGGSGFVGSRLVRSLVADGASVTVLTRKASSCPSFPLEVDLKEWAPPDGVNGVADVLRDADLVVNLAGAPVVSRWTDAGKATILASRVDSTALIAKAVESLDEESRPRAVVSASAVGYYGSYPKASADALDESSPSGADSDFLVDVCKQWEAAAEPMSSLTRLVVLRLGVVLAPGGGALARMLPIFQLGAGGPVGSGEQAVSWIHCDDLVRLIIEAGTNEQVRGVYNATGPTPTTMKGMSQALAASLNRPCLFPVPAIALQLLYGDGAQVVVEGQSVRPTKWLDHGFTFTHETVESAMDAVASEVRR